MLMRMNTIRFWIDNARPMAIPQSLMPTVLDVCMASQRDGFSLLLSHSAVLGVVVGGVCAPESPNARILLPAKRRCYNCWLSEADSIWVSLDGLGQYHDDIRGKGVFERLVKHIADCPCPAKCVASSPSNPTPPSPARIVFVNNPRLRFVGGCGQLW
jgi:hypothetical protein